MIKLEQPSMALDDSRVKRTFTAGSVSTTYKLRYSMQIDWEVGQTVREGKQ